jgi:hypothetical protein
MLATRPLKEFRKLLARATQHEAGGARLQNRVTTEQR